MSIDYGTAVDVWEFRNAPAVAARLEPPGKHDACFLPRSAHVTGDVQIHEMACVGDELCFVNTRFSCLATHDPDHSFRPIWRPKFISQLAPDDRCHLNRIGLRMQAGGSRGAGMRSTIVGLIPGSRILHPGGLGHRPRRNRYPRRLATPSSSTAPSSSPTTPSATSPPNCAPTPNPR